MSADGSLAASISSDKTAKIFDVLNFDMIAMLRLTFVPSCAAWLFKVRPMHQDLGTMAPAASSGAPCAACCFLFSLSFYTVS